MHTYLVYVVLLSYDAVIHLCTTLHCYHSHQCCSCVFVTFFIQLLTSFVVCNFSVAGSSASRSVSLKSLSLIILTLQNAALIVVMRYVRTRSGPMFASSTAVIMSELLKVGACLAVIFFEEGRTFTSWFAHLNENIFKQPYDCLRVSIPAFVYMLQNNLIYVAASNLDAATFQVSVVMSSKVTNAIICN
jgi:Nucleotide-sugar transporter